MTVAGISMVKNEADMIGQIVRHMVQQVDFVIVADNMSTDVTRAILDDLARFLPVTVVDDNEVAYMQSEKMTRLARMAAERGADWVVPFDGDEWWYSPFGRIGDILANVPAQYLTASATLYDHVVTGSDPAGDNPLDTIGWRRRDPGGLPKVACRTRPDLIIEQGNHGATYDGGTTDWPDQLIVRHFPYRSPAQFAAKAINGAAAYEATVGLPDDAGRHWKDYGALAKAHGEDALADVFRQWFFEPFPEYRHDLIYDPISGLA